MNMLLGSLPGPWGRSSCKQEADLGFPSSVVNSALSRSEEATEEATAKGQGGIAQGSQGGKAGTCSRNLLGSEVGRACLVWVVRFYAL